MKRLLWKEFHEQWLWALAALATGPLYILFARRVQHQTSVIPSGTAEPLLIYAVFAIWGATRMPHERSHGRLTLTTLPARGWQVWGAKVLPGVVTTLLSAALTVFLGRIGASANTLRFQFTAPELAGAIALAFAGAFLASLAFGPVPSSVLGILFALFGPAFQWVLWDTLPRHLWEPWAGPITAAFMGIAATVLLLGALWGMTSRQHITKPRLWRWVSLAVMLLVALPMASGFAHNAGEFLPAIGSQSGGTPQVVVSRREGLVSDARQGYRITSGTRYGGAIWVERLDGANPRRVFTYTADIYNAYGPPDIGPLAFLADGRLLFQVRRAGARAAEWRIWSADRPDAPAVAALPAPRDGSPWAVVAAEPSGARCAVLRLPVGALLPADRHDLWLFTPDAPRGGRWRLLAPSTGADDVMWRAGRIYLRDDTSLWSVTPEGTGRRDEKRLPPEPGQSEVVETAAGQSEVVEAAR